MQIWLIIVDLGLSVGSFLYALVIGYLAWSVQFFRAADAENPRRSEAFLRVGATLLALTFFAIGVYALRCLSEQRFVPLRFALTHALILTAMIVGTIRIAFSLRRHRQLNELVQSGRADEAVELLEGWIRDARRPQPDLHSQLGLIHLNAGDPELAARQFRLALDLSNESPMYLSNMAIALHDLGRTDEALEMLARAEERHPAGRKIYVHNRCYFLAKAGRIDEARQLLPQVEENHEQMTARLSPLHKRKLAETLSEMQHLCE